MTRHALHRIRSVRKGLLERLYDREPEVPAVAVYARALVARYILDSGSEGLQREIKTLCSEYLPSGWTVTGDLVRFPAPSSSALPSLPDTHRWKGGAARHLLRRALGICELPYPLRDLDIARIGRGWTDVDLELSSIHMAEDFSHGHGVEVKEDRPRYFQSRDLSINEILAGNGEILCTVVCLLDTLAQVLRPCRYFAGTLHQPGELSSRASAKMIRFRAELYVAGESWAFAGVPADQVVDAQHLAFEVNKAFSRGEKIGWETVSTAVALGVLPRPVFEELGDPLFAALAVLIDETYGGAGFYTAFPADLRGRFEVDPP